MADGDNIERVAGAVKAIVESVPVYKDAIQPFAKEIGRAGDTIGKTVNIVLTPLRGLVWSYDRIEGLLHSALPEKLKGIPPENIQTPPPNIAVPVIEALRYTGDEPVLRAMYLRLLATAMDARKVGTAHPAFAEIIRQLTPDEARIVEMFARVKSMPVIWFRTTTCSEQYDLVKEKAGVAHPQFYGVYTSNLVRLNLLSFTAVSLSKDKADSIALENTPAAIARRQHIETCRGEIVKVSRGSVSLTDLGASFSRAVL